MKVNARCLCFISWNIKVRRLKSKREVLLFSLSTTKITILLVQKLEASYQVILTARDNDDIVLEEKLLKVFNRTVHTACRVADSMKHSMDEARVNQLLLNDVFLTDKFGEVNQLEGHNE